jgi:hypothetical protein
VTFKIITFNIITVGGVGSSEIYLGELRVDDRMILKWIFKNRVGRSGLDRSGIRIGISGAGICEYVNDPTGSIKCKEFVE